MVLIEIILKIICVIALGVHGVYVCRELFYHIKSMKEDVGHHLSLGFVFLGGLFFDVVIVIYILRL